MQFGFEQWLIIGLLVTLFFKDEAKRYIQHKLGLSAPEENLQDGMNYLKMHFNDELTHILTDLQVDQKEGFRLSHDNQADGLKELQAIKTRINEMKEYGVKIRA